VSRYQKGRTNLDFTGARDSEWQWHQLGCMQVCTSLQRDNHASTPPLSFFTDQMPFLPPNQQHQSTEGTKAMRVNMNKTKMTVSGGSQKVRQKAARWPCGVCSKGVGSNSLQCNSCQKWVHKKCQRVQRVACRQWQSHSFAEAA